MARTRLITWNVAGRVSKLGAQAAAIAAVNADIVCLQEVTARTAPLWVAALEEAGFAAIETALDALPPKTHRPAGDAPASSASAARAPAPRALARPTLRRLAVLTAARSPIERLPAPGVPWAERVLCGVIDGIEVVNVHSPIAPSPELAKIRTHETVAAYLREPSSRPRVLCGDLNTPRRELEDGTLLTFAHDTHGRLRPERGERWDRAERSLVRDLGWTDAWRHLHGYGTRDASWTFKDDRGGWRLDHVLVDGLEPVASTYCHDWRREGLSDHSALMVDVQPPAATTS